MGPAGVTSLRTVGGSQKGFKHPILNLVCAMLSCCALAMRCQPEQLERARVDCVRVHQRRSLSTCVIFTPASELLAGSFPNVALAERREGRGETDGPLPGKTTSTLGGGGRGVPRISLRVGASLLVSVRSRDISRDASTIGSVAPGRGLRAVCRASLQNRACPRMTATLCTGGFTIASLSSHAMQRPGQTSPRHPSSTPALNAAPLLHAHLPSASSIVECIVGRSQVCMPAGKSMRGQNLTALRSTEHEVRTGQCMGMQLYASRTSCIHGVHKVHPRHALDRDNFSIIRNPHHSA